MFIRSDFVSKCSIYWISNYTFTSSLVGFYHEICYCDKMYWICNYYSHFKIICWITFLYHVIRKNISKFPLIFWVIFLFLCIYLSSFIFISRYLSSGTALHWLMRVVGHFVTGLNRLLLSTGFLQGICWICIFSFFS